MPRLADHCVHKVRPQSESKKPALHPEHISLVLWVFALGPHGGKGMQPWPVCTICNGIIANGSCLHSAARATANAHEEVVPELR
eukprot:3423730-Alexandrium_andersonii.AAC.1